MRRPILLAALLAAGLSLAAAAEADDRGHGQARKFHDRSFHQGQHFAQPSSLRSFGRSYQGHHFADRHDDRRSAPRDQDRRFTGWDHDRRFADWDHDRRFGRPHPGPWFDHRREVLRFAARPAVVPLSRQPGYRVLAGRQILPFFGARPVHPSGPFVASAGHRFPTFVRVAPGPHLSPRPGFPSGDHGFGKPGGGLTIIVRDPAGRPPWQ